MMIIYEGKDGKKEAGVDVMRITLIPEKGEEIAKLKRDDTIWEIHSDGYEGHDNADTAASKHGGGITGL